MTGLKRLLAVRLPMLATCALLAVAALPTLAADKPLPRDSVYQLPIALVDQDAKRSEWKSRRGKPQVVSMFYTSCRYVCPLIVDSGKAIEKSLTPAQHARLGILLVSMDPARDTPAALKSVADKRKLDLSLWTLASPKPGDVRGIAGLLGIRYRALADGEFNHTSALVLLDADGRVLARTEQVGSKPDPAFVAAVRRAADGPAAR